MILSLAAYAGNNAPTGNNSNTDPSKNVTDNSQTENDATVPGETPDAKPDDNPASEPEGTKILVAYFSATNNTVGVAQRLADGLGADLYEIVPKQTYTSADLNYGDSALRSAADTAAWLDGRRFSAGASAEDVLAWANGLGID